MCAPSLAQGFIWLCTLRFTFLTHNYVHYFCMTTPTLNVTQSLKLKQQMGYLVIFPENTINCTICGHSRFIHVHIKSQATAAQTTHYVNNLQPISQKTGIVQATLNRCIVRGIQGCNILFIVMSHLLNLKILAMSCQNRHGF